MGADQSRTALLEVLGVLVPFTMRSIGDYIIGLISMLPFWGQLRIMVLIVLAFFIFKNILGAESRMH